MSEGKCHDKPDHSKWRSQRPDKVKARVIPSKVNRAVTREQTVGLVERLRVMDRPKLQIKHKPELNPVSDLPIDPLGGFLFGKVFDIRLCMFPSCSHCFTGLGTYFVFSVAHLLPMLVNFFGFNGNFNGKMTKNIKW